MTARSGCKADESGLDHLVGNISRLRRLHMSHPRAHKEHFLDDWKVSVQRFGAFNGGYLAIWP